MIHINTYVAVGVLLATGLAFSGATYVLTSVNLKSSASCATSLPATGSSKPDLPRGTPVPLNQGKIY